MDFESAMQTFAEAWMAANRSGLPVLGSDNSNSNNKNKTLPMNLVENSTRSADHEEKHGVDGSEKNPEKDEGTVEHEIESNQIALDNGILENKKPPENEEESKHANKDLQTDDIILEKPKHLEDLDSNSLNKGLSIRDDSSLLKDAIVKSKNASIQPNNVSIQPNSITTPMSSGSDLDQRTLDTRVSQRRIPVFVMCTLVTGSPETPMEEKFSAATLADVLVDVPASLPFLDVVSYVLNQLHLMKEDTFCFKGEIIITNWKPLNIEAICHEDGSKTVGDIFRQISTVPTLKLTLRPKRSTMPSLPISHLDTRERVMSILFEQYYRDWKVKTSSACETSSTNSSGSEAAKQLPNFSNTNRWHYQGSPSPNPLFSSINVAAAAAAVAAGGAQRNSTPPPPVSTSYLAAGRPSLTNPNLSSINAVNSDKPMFPGAANPSHHFGGYGSLGIPPSMMTSSVTDQFQVAKPRMRICFDPETEIPKLQKWFAENNHPTRQQVEEYVRELNSLESRRGRRPLDVNNVIYWFKNTRTLTTRAAVKRAEMKARIGCPNTPVANVTGSPPDKSHHALMPSASTDTSTTLASAMWPWFNSNPLMSMQDNSKKQLSASEAGDDLIHGDEAEKLSKSEKPNNGSGGPPLDDLDEEMSKDVTDDENNVTSNSSEGQRSPPPTMVFGQTPPMGVNPGIGPSGLPLSMMNSNMMYMTQYMNPYLQSSGRNASPISSLIDADRRKRNRTFIDPVSEVPRLEEWFMLNTHPSHALIARYTEELNQLPYRQKFPQLEQKNIQFWFKNRRAKCKRMNNCI